jgi:hypothetical protein
MHNNNKQSLSNWSCQHRKELKNLGVAKPEETTSTTLSRVKNVVGSKPLNEFPKVTDIK